MATVINSSIGNHDLFSNGSIASLLALADRNPLGSPQQ
jgi:hypothetical protein